MLENSIGSAVGVEIAGRAVEYLKGRDGWNIIQAYHAVFWLYSGMGVLNALLTWLLSSKCEVEKKEPEIEEAEILLDEMEDRSPTNSEGRFDRTEQTGQETAPAPKASWTSRFAQISKPTRSVMYKLWSLLIIDSLADGMVG